MLKVTKNFPAFLFICQFVISRSFCQIKQKEKVREFQITQNPTIDVPRKICAMRISRTFSTFFNLVKRAGNYKFLLISQFVVIRTFLLGISRTRIKSAGNSNYAKLKFNYLAKFVQF